MRAIQCETCEMSTPDSFTAFDVVALCPRKTRVCNRKTAPLPSAFPGRRHHVARLNAGLATMEASEKMRLPIACAGIGVVCLLAPVLVVPLILLLTPLLLPLGFGLTAFGLGRAGIIVTLRGSPPSSRARRSRFGHGHESRSAHHRAWAESPWALAWAASSPLNVRLNCSSPGG